VNILVENGDPGLANLGDVAMLEVALLRLRELFPGAQRAFLTTNREGLAALDPEVRPVGEDVRDDADLIVAAGGGYLTDYFSDLAIERLRALLRAKRDGRRAVMVGQGLGPVTRRRLLRTAGATLPRLDALLVRESRSSPIWARARGAEAVVTQDDALELAARERPATLGHHLGVSLHVAQYTRLHELLAAPLQAALAHVAAPTIALPIRRDHDARAARVIAAILGIPTIALPSTRALREAVGACRVVLSTTYHGAVFALAQGAAVVGVYGSSYYREKLVGLVADFPGSMQALDARGASFAALLHDALAAAWQDAPHQRPTLVSQVERWISTSRAAWRASLG